MFVYVVVCLLAFVSTMHCDIICVDSYLLTQANLCFFWISCGECSLSLLFGFVLMHVHVYTHECKYCEMGSVTF